jgi:hypothetical protein
MYEVKASLKQPEAVREQMLDDLIALFEAHGKDATCGLVQDEVLVFVEEDLLSPITNLILHYADEVKIQIVVEDEELAVV